MVLFVQQGISCVQIFCQEKHIRLQERYNVAIPTGAAEKAVFLSLPWKKGVVSEWKRT